MKWPEQPERLDEWLPSMKAAAAMLGGLVSRAQLRQLKAAGAPCFHASGRVRPDWALLCVMAQEKAIVSEIDGADEDSPKARDWIQERARINSKRDAIKLEHERGQVLDRSEVREFMQRLQSWLESQRRRSNREIAADLEGRTASQIHHALNARDEEMNEQNRQMSLDFLEAEHE